ncbi:MAG: transporter substrate-binding domain-containing protein [Alphaproteobacteria bacterium]|nr:transporter substrate-binding domain-containing protein [Alphaproteobacteria bacterium]
MRNRTGFKLHSFLCCLLFTIWTFHGVMANDHKTQQIFLSTLKIAGLIGSSADDKYTTLLNIAAQDHDARLVISEVPGNRLEHQFRMIGTGCIFPEYRAPEDADVVISHPFNQAPVHLVWRRGDHPPTTLEGLRVGLVKGYGYDFADFSNVKSITHVESERQNLLMLLFRRVDTILSYFPDLPLAANPGEIEKISYNARAPLHTSPERIACFDTPENRAFLTSLNQTIARLEKSGELAEVLAPYFYGLPEDRQAAVKD